MRGEVGRDETGGNTYFPGRGKAMIMLMFQSLYLPYEILTCKLYFTTLIQKYNYDYKIPSLERTQL